MTNNIPRKALKEIHNTIKYVWEYDIPADYDHKILLKEDTLKCSLYYHIRRRLEALLKKYNIMIFTEFNTHNFRKTGFRADLIIAQMDFDSDDTFWGDCVKSYVAVFELKFKGDYSSASDDIAKDYEKTRRYIEKLNLGEDCHYYIATIWECYPDSKWWLDKDTTWAKNRLTELNADHDSRNIMNFYIKEH